MDCRIVCPGRRAVVIWPNNAMPCTSRDGRSFCYLLYLEICNDKININFHTATRSFPGLFFMTCRQWSIINYMVIAWAPLRQATFFIDPNWINIFIYSHSEFYDRFHFPPGRSTTMLMTGGLNIKAHNCDADCIAFHSHAMDLVISRDFLDRVG